MRLHLNSAIKSTLLVRFSLSFFDSIYFALQLFVLQHASERDGNPINFNAADNKNECSRWCEKEARRGRNAITLLHLIAARSRETVPRSLSPFLLLCARYLPLIKVETHFLAYGDST
jgi:hypothetical protein